MKMIIIIMMMMMMIMVIKIAILILLLMTITIRIKILIVICLHSHLIADMIRLIHSVLVDFQFVYYFPLTPTRIRKASCDVRQ